MCRGRTTTRLPKRRTRRLASVTTQAFASTATTSSAPASAAIWANTAVGPGPISNTVLPRTVASMSCRYARTRARSPAITS